MKSRQYIQSTKRVGQAISLNNKDAAPTFLKASHGREGLTPRDRIRYVMKETKFLKASIHIGFRMSFFGVARLSALGSQTQTYILGSHSYSAKGMSTRSILRTIDYCENFAGRRR